MSRRRGLGRPPRRYFLAALLVAALCVSPGAAGAPPAAGGAEARCEVCQDFLERFYSSLKEKHSDFSMASIEEELIKTCMNTKGKENRLCYYLGATGDAATKIISEVSRPMSGHVPVTKICEKLKKVDIQICELKYVIKLLMQKCIVIAKISRQHYKIVIVNETTVPQVHHCLEDFYICCQFATTQLSSSAINNINSLMSMPVGVGMPPDI